MEPMIIGNCQVGKSYLIGLYTDTTKKIFRLEDSTGHMNFENVQEYAKSFFDSWNEQAREKQKDPNAKKSDAIIFETFEVVEICNEQMDKITEMMSEIINIYEPQFNLDDKPIDVFCYYKECFDTKTQNSKKKFKRKRYFWE